MDNFDRTQELDMDEFMKTIPVICSWCNQIYHIKQWNVDSGKPTGVSHGMCPECEEKQQKELEQFILEKEQRNNEERE
jgi:hypothetical protein